MAVKNADDNECTDEEEKDKNLVSYLLDVQQNLSSAGEALNNLQNVISFVAIVIQWYV